MKFKRHKDITNLLNQFIKEKTKLTGINYFVSGGCLVDVDKKLETKDIDIYFNDEDSFLRLNEALKKLTEKKEGIVGIFKKIISYSEVELVSETDNACTYRIEFNNHHYVIQLIRRIFGDFETVLSEFDIPLLKRYLTPDGMLHISSGYEPVLKNESKTITEEAIRRLIKYKNKGFELKDSEFLDLIKRSLQQEYLKAYYSKDEVDALTSVLNNSGNLDTDLTIEVFEIITQFYPEFCSTTDIKTSRGIVSTKFTRYFFAKRCAFLFNQEPKKYKKSNLELIALIYCELNKGSFNDNLKLLSELNAVNFFEEAFLKYPEIML